MNLNWQFIIDSLPLYREASWTTHKLGFWGILISSIIGFVCSIILYFRVRVVKAIVQAYIEVSRNTPLLIQLFFLYFGLTKLGITLSEKACSIIGLSFLGGAIWLKLSEVG